MRRIAIALGAALLLMGSGVTAAANPPTVIVLSVYPNGSTVPPNGDLCGLVLSGDGFTVGSPVTWTLESLNTVIERHRTVVDEVGHWSNIAEFPQALGPIRLSWTVSGVETLSGQWVFNNECLGPPSAPVSSPTPTRAPHPTLPPTDTAG